MKRMRYSNIYTYVLYLNLCSYCFQILFHLYNIVNLFINHQIKLKKKAFFFSILIFSRKVNYNYLEFKIKTIFSLLTRVRFIIITHIYNYEYKLLNFFSRIYKYKLIYVLNEYAIFYL
jgi:hypothetical protein